VLQDKFERGELEDKIATGMMDAKGYAWYDEDPNSVF
jgi:hypothetical protein